MASVSSATVYRASDFIQSIGVCAHINSTSTPYADTGGVLSNLNYLGVSHVRVAAPAMTQAPIYQMLGSAGIRFDFIIAWDPAISMSVLDTLAPYIQTIEGPNEVNHSLVQYQGVVGPASAVPLQQALYAAVHSDPILNGNGRTTPVLDFTVSVGSDTSSFGDTSAYADYTNIHSYAGGGTPQSYFMQTLINQNGLSHNLPVVITEMGNYTMIDNGNGVTNAVQAKLITYGLLDAYKAGVVSTYLYQLQDASADPGNTDYEQHFGLFNFDGTAKPSAIAVHNLTSILTDTGATASSFATQPFSYSLSGLPRYGFQMVLEKAGGTYELALWQEERIWNYTNSTEITIVPTTVTVTLGRVYQTVNVYDPLTGSAPIATYHHVNSLQLGLGADAMIVEAVADLPGQVILTGTAGGSFVSVGADTIIGGSGSATIDIYGNATTTGGSGALQINLGAGGALIVGGSGALTVANTGSNETVKGGTGTLTYSDTAGNNTIMTGISASNTVTTGAGNDTVTLYGASLLTLGSGQVSVVGSGGGSTVMGTSGGLVMTDLVGGNTVTGGTGAFSITRGAGAEVINTVAATSNRVVLGTGRDTVNASGATTVTAGSGTALVTLNSAGNSVIGGTGALTVMDNGKSNTVVGGVGTLSYASSTTPLGNAAPGRPAMAKVVLGTGASTLVLGGPTSVIGGAGLVSVSLDGAGSLVTGASGALTVKSTKGGSTVVGGTGSLSFTSIAGNTLVTTGQGTNRVVLGSGNDTINVITPTILTGGTGQGIVNVTSSGNSLTSGAGVLTINDSKGGNTINGGTGALVARVTAGGDIITTRNTSGTSMITLGTGNDTVIAGGSTNVYGGAANLVVSGTGALTVTGATGSVTLNGGASADTVFTGDNTRNLLNLGSGASSVLSHGADTINASLAAGAAGARIYVGASATITGGTGTLYLSGPGRMSVIGGTGAVTGTASAGNSYIAGGRAGGNLLYTLGGNTTLVGGGAGDRLSDTGTVGGNILRAGAGGATLTAGSGNDTLVGGSGADTFVLAQAGAAHSTVIQGYTKGTDKLSLTGFPTTAAAISNQQMVGGNLQLTLADTSTVTLVGVSSL